MPRVSKGALSVITGCMFSGKSTELLRCVQRAKIARRNTWLFKPSVDDRFSVGKVVSHDKISKGAWAITEPEEIFAVDGIVGENRVLGFVAIDEVQFFGETIIDVVERLLQEGHDVMVAGLDTDFRHQPFGSVPYFLSVAEKITKLSAICMQCGNEASFSQRIIDGKPADPNSPVMLVGGNDKYEARCRSCFELPGIIV